MKKNIPEWNAIKVKEKGFNWFKKVYEDYVTRKVQGGKYKKLTEPQMKSLYDNILASLEDEEVKEEITPQVETEKNEK